MLTVNRRAPMPIARATVRWSSGTGRRVGYCLGPEADDWAVALGASH